jgi:Zn-dependent protease
MGWSWRIGKIAGIDIFVHFTFFILLGWIGISYYLKEGNWGQALYGLAFILTLFGIVVLHELGHALAARRYGIPTRDITLLPIGGVARLERMPERPEQELVVALAGPAVNVVLAIGLFLVLWFGNAIGSAENFFKVASESFIGQMFAVNVILAIFNMLPAFPMDGGRVLRAILAMNMDYAQATRIAAVVGQTMALLFGFLGLFGNPFLIFIALFVWMGAANESGMVQIRSALAGLPVKVAMITDFKSLAPEDSLELAADYVLAGFQQDFPVVDGDEQVVGILTRRKMIEGLSRPGGTTTVGEMMIREFRTAEPGEMLESAIVRLQDGLHQTIPILQHGRLVGLLNSENLSEFLMIRESTRAANQRNRRLHL